MHPNPAFRSEARDRATTFARNRGFGVVNTVIEGAMQSAHVPFLLDKTTIEAHLVRSNPIARALGKAPLEVLLIVSGPDAYISPDWYGIEDKVPTWNYVAVHLRGSLELADEQTLLGHLERLSARFERDLPKPEWTHHKMTPGVMAKMMRQIVPVKMQVTGVESTFKLNQNQPVSARQGAADQLATGTTTGQNTTALAELMRRVEP